MGSAGAAKVDRVRTREGECCEEARAPAHLDLQPEPDQDLRAEAELGQRVLPANALGPVTPFHELSARERNRGIQGFKYDDGPHYAWLEKEQEEKPAPVQGWSKSEAPPRPATVIDSAIGLQDEPAKIVMARARLLVFYLVVLGKRLEPAQIEMMRRHEASEGFKWLRTWIKAQWSCSAVEDMRMIVARLEARCEGGLTLSPKDALELSLLREFVHDRVLWFQRDSLCPLPPIISYGRLKEHVQVTLRWLKRATQLMGRVRGLFGSMGQASRDGRGRATSASPTLGGYSRRHPRVVWP